jgi:hypothetical protein
MLETVSTVSTPLPVFLCIDRRSLGNFHALILFHDEKERELVREAVHRLVHRAIALDGTCELY